MPYEDTSETVFSELLMIGYFCGFTDRPKVGNIMELMKRCISLGPQGYGLALYALTIALSGGTIPYFSVNPIPFGLVGRITRICVIEAPLLKKYGIVSELGFYTTTVEREVGEDEENVYIVEYPEAFAVVIIYKDMDGNENTRAFIIQHTQNSNYPWISIIPTDKHIRILGELCRNNKFYASVEELREMARIVEKEKARRRKRRTISKMISTLDEEFNMEYGEDESV